MIIARAASGIGAIFCAPLCGALFIFGLLRTGWCIAAVIALAASAAVLLSAISGLYVFDRNNDGIDDGGLDLHFAATDATHLPPIPLIVGCLRRSGPCIRLRRYPCSNPRSPPLTF
jgi:H+/Cl- antiporter ClcA